jgi:hypothetical protein
MAFLHRNNARNNHHVDITSFQLRQLGLGEAPVVSVEADAIVLDALSLMSQYPFTIAVPSIDKQFNKLSL